MTTSNLSDLTKILAPETIVKPPLDEGFIPACLVNRRFREMVKTSPGGGEDLHIGLERSKGSVSVYKTKVFSKGSENFALNLPYVERILKFLLWQRGGWKVYIGGPSEIGDFIRSVYSKGGARAFDAEFMSGVYENPFTVESVKPNQVPHAKEMSLPLGRNLDGCRVGFDLGASDRKASAVKDGQVLFSEEVVWDPKTQTDPEYHYKGIVDSIRRAASHLPRLDAIGGSSAGIYINNRVRVASLFRGIGKKDFEEKIAGIVARVGKEFNAPIEVVNDGDVTALAGSMSLEDNPVLGIAMGSSEATGYVDGDGNITGWLNELAFAPVDYRTNAPVDEWSRDSGCGVQYFSQVGATRVAESAGMKFSSGITLPEKLVELQAKMAAGDALAQKVYETIGVYLGYAVVHYADFYNLKHVLILGRVTTGAGGDIILDTARDILKREFPSMYEKIKLALPDEKNRRVGQSIAAASLPKIKRVVE